MFPCWPCSDIFFFRIVILFSADYTCRQIELLIPDGYHIGYNIKKYFKESLNKAEKCIRSSIDGSSLEFDYLVTWQYALFLYFLSRTIWTNTNKEDEAVRIFYLNKALNGIDLFYKIKMPDFFLIGHTSGIVFSRATYSNYSVFHQGCTVGRQDDKYPCLDSGVVMFPNSMIIGDCHVKENTVLAPGVRLINTSTPGNCIVFDGKGGRPVYKELTSYYADKYFVRNIDK